MAASYEVVNNVGIITCQQKPVNQLCLALRKGIYSGISKANNDPNVAAIVIICDGKTFMAGADIKEFPVGKHRTFPTITDIHKLNESCSKPVISAIHGTALGGGFEVALATHYRIGTSRSFIGLPEVNIGILPGAGGTQRLPRLVGPMIAAEIICSGKHIPAQTAFKYGILDDIIYIDRHDTLATERSKLRERAIMFALNVANNDISSRIVSKRQCPKMDKMFYEKLSAQFAKQRKGWLSPQLCLESIHAAQNASTFEEGIIEERKNSYKLATGPQSRALQHFFFSQRMCAKIPNINKNSKALDIKSVGIIGCGTMGGGILMSFIEANIPVTILEIEQKYLDKGLAVVKKNWMRQVNKGRLSMQKYEKYISSELLKPTLNYTDFSNVDIVIEAVFERPDIKQKVFKKLDVVCKPSCILASNTSFIPIQIMAKATKRPNKVIGCHFFAPANKMKLLENVRFEGGSDDVTCLTVQKMAKLIGKVGVLVGSCLGFVGNRMAARRGMELEQLLLEGASPTQIDFVCTEVVGCKMGTVQVRDLSGLDLFYNPKNIKSIADNLISRYNRRGLKNGKGFYDYPNLSKGDRTPVSSDIVNNIIIELAEKKKIARRNISNQEILERLFYPLINEGFNVLSENIAQRPSDIDIVHIFGYGFPEYRGGPMYWAQNEIGFKNLYNALLKYYNKYNKSNFKPAKLLKECVDKGVTDLNRFWAKRVKNKSSKL